MWIISFRMRKNTASMGQEETASQWDQNLGNPSHSDKNVENYDPVGPIVDCFHYETDALWWIYSKNYTKEKIHGGLRM